MQINRHCRENLLIILFCIYLNVLYSTTVFLMLNADVLRFFMLLVCFFSDTDLVNEKKHHKNKVFLCLIFIPSTLQI